MIETCGWGTGACKENTPRHTHTMATLAESTARVLDSRGWMPLSPGFPHSTERNLPVLVGRVVKVIDRQAMVIGGPLPKVSVRHCLKTLQIVLNCIRKL